MSREMNPQHQRVKEVFDDWAERGRADSMAASHEPFVRGAFEALALEAGARYLDIGCGNGYSVRWAADRCPDGRAAGIDIAPSMIQRARELSTGIPNVEFHETVFPEHPFEPHSFDAILSMEVFYYLPDLGAGLAEVTRLLRPGGLFACAVDFYEENVASHSWPDDVGVGMTLLSASQWQAAMVSAGMEVVEQRRLKVPLEEASEEWKATEGSLLTLAQAVA